MGTKCSDVALIPGSPGGQTELLIFCIHVDNATLDRPYWGDNNTGLHNETPVSIVDQQLRPVMNCNQ